MRRELEEKLMADFDSVLAEKVDEEMKINDTAKKELKLFEQQLSQPLQSHYYSSMSPPPILAG